MAWRDSFVVLTTTTTAARTTTTSSLGGDADEGKPSCPSSSSASLSFNTDNDDDNNNDNETEQEEDSLLLVERRVRELRRNRDNDDFVVVAAAATSGGAVEENTLADHSAKFRSALADLAHQQQQADLGRVLAYQQQERDREADAMPTWDRLFQHRDSSREVFTDNPLLDASFHHQNNSNHTFRQLLKLTNSPSAAASYVASSGGEQFRDVEQPVKGDGDGGGGGENDLDRIKRRMSGLGKSLKKSLSFRKLQ